MTKNISLVFLLPTVIWGCTSIPTDQTNQASQVNTASTSPPSQVTSTQSENKSIPQPTQKQTIASGLGSVDTFTIDEMFAANSGGCGMSLQAKSAKGTRNFVFFNGISPNSMVMKINGKMTRFSLVEATGNEFYGQKNFQTFISEDKTIEVKVAVARGKVGEIESLDISTGVMLVKTADGFQELEVIGGAGC